MEHFPLPSPIHPLHKTNFKEFLFLSISMKRVRILFLIFLPLVLLLNLQQNIMALLDDTFSAVIPSFSPFAPPHTHTSAEMNKNNCNHKNLCV